MALQLVTLIVLGLMCGSELNVALFGHPILKQQPLATHILVRASLAALLGRVMPFWGASCALLNLLLLLPLAQLNHQAWRFAAIAFAIQVLAVIFSLVAPVPINNRIAKWTPDSIPDDWIAQESRWDMYHLFRTCVLIVAFVLLSLSVAVR